MSPNNLYHMMYRQSLLVKSMKQKWEELGIQALVMPNYPIPAFESSSVDKLGNFREYQLIWSLLHYPAGVVPVTSVTEQEAENAHNYQDGIND